MPFVKSELSWLLSPGIWCSLEPNKGHHSLHATQWGYFFLAMTKLGGDSSYAERHWITCPHACSRAEHRAQNSQHARGTGTKPPERTKKLQHAGTEREPFSAMWVILGRHSEGHFGGDLEDHLPWETKTWILNENFWAIADNIWDFSPWCWEAAHPHERQDKNTVRNSQDSKQNPEKERQPEIQCLASYIANGFHHVSVKRKYTFHGMYDENIASIWKS